MKRNTVNFLVDAASMLVVFGLVATGLLVSYVLPPGSGTRRLLWGLGRHDWGDIHFWIAFSGGVLLLIHLALHWQWVCVTTLRLFRLTSNAEQSPASRWGRNSAGVALTLTLIGLFCTFVWAARLGVQDSAFAGAGHERGIETSSGAGAEADDNTIRGSMTLADAALAGDMPAETLRAKLGLPERVSAGERLGRLSHEHGFSISRVREIVQESQRRSSSSQQQRK